MKKRLIAALTAVQVLLNLSALNMCVSAEACVNVASPYTNMELTVSSETHPQGGRINGSQTLVPLERIYDGDISNSGLVYLSLVKSATAVSYDEVYAPQSTGMPVHICLDLGAVYDISKIVIRARSDAGTNFTDVMLRASNDVKCLSSDWEGADMYTIYDRRGIDTTLSKGTEISAALESGNNSFRYIVLSRECAKGAETYLSFGDLEVYADPKTAKSETLVGASRYAATGASLDVSVLKYSGLCKTADDKLSFIKAKYSGDVLLDAECAELSRSQINDGEGLSLQIPDDKTEAALYSWKFFLFENLASLKPLSQPKQTYGYCTEFYVSVTGSDDNDGMTKQAPFKTIGRAIEEVRQLPAAVDDDIVVNIAEGTYFLDDMLRLYPEDSGRGGHRVIYRGSGMPKLSGGTPISGFAQSQTYDNLWEVELEDAEYVYDLYINDKRAKIASSKYEITAEAVYDDASTDYAKDGLYVSAKDVGLYQNAEDVYLNYSSDWTFTKARVAAIETDPDNAERHIVKMRQPYWSSYFGGSNTRTPQLEDSFTVSNAFELLDEPGEFYFNKETKILYYYPRAGESIENVEAVIPRLDMLVKLDGRGTQDRVRNITFDGLRFAHTSNSALYLTDYYQSEQGQGLPEKIVQSARFNKYALIGAVDMNHTDGIKFLNNDFVGLGGVGINMVEGVMNTTVCGNAFADIGDTAVAFGHVTHSDAVLGSDGVGDEPASDYMLDLAQGSVVTSSTGGMYWDVMRNNFTAEGKYAFGAAKFVPADGDLSLYDSDGSYIPAWQTLSESEEKQYIMYDFLDYYTVDKIKILFDLGAYSAEKRKNFEVLLSNDPEFEDESTFTVATCRDETGGTKTFNIKAKRKFRYAMVRTLETGGKLALNRIQLLSDDIKPYADSVRCKKLDITNNYFTRIGTGNGVVGSGAAICSYGYEEEINISHNEIYDLPYSAIQIGHGWSDSLTGSKNHYVGYNRIEKICQTLFDGGAIYTISDQMGFVAEGNYIDGLTATVAALYNDNGSTGVLWRNNVVCDTSRAAYVGYLTGGNSFSDTYSTSSKAVDKYGNSVIERMNLLTYGKLTGVAAEIKAAAGLEAAYASVRSRAPQMPLGFASEREVLLRSRSTSYVTELADMLSENIDRILENGEFGEGSGCYPQSVKTRLEELKELPYKDDGETPLETRVQHIVDIRNYLRGLSVN